MNVTKITDNIRYYLNIAEAVAAKSTCLKRRYGAVIVKNDEIISTGYNGAPRNRKNCTDLKFCIRKEMKIPSGCDNFESYCRSVHAEMNAIISAARRDMIDSTLYLVGYDPKTGEYYDTEPCSICKRMIINAGIHNVYILQSSERIKSIYVSEWIENDESLPSKTIGDHLDNHYPEISVDHGLCTDSLEKQMEPKKTKVGEYKPPATVIEQPVTENLDELKSAENFRRLVIDVLRGKLDPDTTICNTYERDMYIKHGKHQTIALNDGTRIKSPNVIERFEEVLKMSELDKKVILLFLLSDDRIVGGVPEEYTHDAGVEICKEIKEHALAKILRNLDPDESYTFEPLGRVECNIFEAGSVPTMVRLPDRNKIVQIPQYLIRDQMRFTNLTRKDKERLFIAFTHQTGNKLSLPKVKEKCLQQINDHYEGKEKLSDGRLIIDKAMAIDNYQMVMLEDAHRFVKIPDDIINIEFATRTINELSWKDKKKLAEALENAAIQFDQEHDITNKEPNPEIFNFNTFFDAYMRKIVDDIGYNQANSKEDKKDED